MVDITYWMVKDFPTTSKEAIVIKVVDIMKDKKSDAIMIIDDNKPIGIFTERDLLIKVVAAKMNPEVTQMEDVMTSPIDTVYKNENYHEVLQTMQDKRFRHMPVVDENQKLLGVITLQSLIRK